MTKIYTCFLALLLSLVSFGASAQDAEITSLIDADFTQFTEGSVDNPVAFASYGSGSFSTYFPSWSASKAYQAGGALLLQDGGSVRTKSFSASSTAGSIRIRTKVRALDSYGGGVTITIGYTSTTLYLSDSEWTELELVGTGSSYTTITVAPYLSASGILLENLKVDQSKSFMAAPKAYQPTSADGTSFTAKWSSVTGATNYYLDVYSYNDKGEKVYVFENEDCGTSRTKAVSGLDSSVTYYYVVRATDGTATSSDSNEIRVVKVITSLATPAPTASVSGDKATISWDAVPDALSYIVSIFQTTTLNYDSKVSVISEDFSKVNICSLEKIEFTFNYKLDQYTDAKGWDGSELALASGYVVLSPFNGGTGSLITPSIDLSSNDGQFTAVYTILESAYGYEGSGGKITIELLDAEDNVLESKTMTLEKGEQIYAADFTKGTADCRLSLSYTGSYKCFINSVNITQIKPAGSNIRVMLEETEIEETSYTIDFDYPSNVAITYYVTAVGETVASAEIATIYSESSDEQTISGSAAIGSIANDATISVAANAGIITVCTDSPADVTVFDLSGRVVLTASAASGANTYACSASGVVIVKVGSKAFKVIL